MFQEGTSAVTFNTVFYLQSNPDVLAAISNGSFQGTALDHFMQFGQFEQRDPNEFFDTDYYLSTNTDVLLAIGNQQIASAFAHFVDFGQTEGAGRSPAAEFETFDNDAYLAANPDVAAAVAAGQFANGFEHFLQFGVNEARAGSGVVIDQNPGEQFELTVLATDNLIGTAGDDLFVGTVATIQATDRIVGGEGNDTFVNVGSGATVVTPVLVGVENVVFQAPIAGITVDYSANADLESVVVSASGAANTITVAAGATVGFENVTGGAQTANFKGATTATTEVTNSTLASLTVNGTTAAALTSATIASLGVANTIGSVATGANLKSLQIVGEGDLTVTGPLAATVTTVNASAATGDVSLVLSETANVTVTGGAGDDVFDFGTALTTKDVVNGGAGFDTVIVDSATDGGFASGAGAAPLNALTSIERVAFDGGAPVTLDGFTLTNTGITNLLFDNAGLVTVDAAGSARTYEFGTAGSGDAIFNMKDGATTLKIDLLGETGDEDASVGILDVNSGTAAMTINLDSQGVLTTAPATGLALFAGSAFNDVAAIDAVAGSTVNVSGSGNLDIGGSVNVVNVDASAFTGLLIVEGSESAEGTRVDTATFAASDVITLGSGTSQVQFSNALDSGNFAVVGAGTPAAATVLTVDVINGFTAGAGGDVLNFGPVAGTPAAYEFLTVDEQAQITTTATTLLGAADIAASLTTEGAWTAFTFQGQTYALFDGGEAATPFDAGDDLLVQLTGVDRLALTEANFA